VEAAQAVMDKEAEQQYLAIYLQAVVVQVVLMEIKQY
jgi:hypothetical protein